jgi:hypothetical protein
VRRGAWTALLVLVMTSTALTTARAQSLETIDFEDHPANPAGTPGTSLDPDFYADRGVRFSLGATVLEYDDGFTPSGTNGLEMCYSVEFCSTPFLIGFDSPQQSVTISVGYSGALDEAVPVMMIAYDANGGPLDVDETLLGPGSPVPVTQPLTVGPTDPFVAEELGSDGLISTVEIRWSDETRVMNSLAIDDLVFEPFVPFVSFETQPTELSFDAAGAVSEVLVTNVGNVAAIFDVALDGDADAFALDDSRCREALDPGASCIIGVGFDPGEPGEYTAGVVLISRQLEQNHVIPIAASTPVVNTSPTTEPGDTTEPTDPGETTEATDAGQTTQETSEPTATAVEGGERGPDLMVPLTLVIVVVIVGGGALLFRLRPRRARTRKTTETRRTRATITVSPDRGASAVTVRDGQPVTAVRVLSGPGSTTLMEEDRQ